MDTPELTLARAEQLADLGRWTEAIDCLSPALAAPETTGDAHFLLARCLLATQRPIEAERAAKESLRHDPQEAHAYVMIGYAQLATNHFRKALRTAQRAAALDPLSVSAQLILVQCWLRHGLGHRGRARAAGAQALRINAQAPTAFYAAALAESRSGRRHRQAAEGYARAGLALDPHDTDLLLLLGDILRKSHRHAEAGHTYVAAGKLDPTDNRARQRLTKFGPIGLAGLGLAGKLSIFFNGGRLLRATHAHALALAVYGTLVLLFVAALTTGTKLYRNRALPESIRLQLRSDYVNSALVWLRLAGVLLLAIAGSVLIDPRGSHLPRPWAGAFATIAVLAVWTSLRLRTGPPLTLYDVREWFRPRRRAGRST